jgi:hypothetical protein
MEQSACGLSRHAEITVRGAAHYTFKKPEHAAHAIHFIQRSDEMHFGSARIRETDLYAAVYKRAYQTFSAIHRCGEVTGEETIITASAAKITTPLANAISAV